MNISFREYVLYMADLAINWLYFGSKKGGRECDYEVFEQFEEPVCKRLIDCSFFSLSFVKQFYDSIGIMDKNNMVSN